MKNPKARSPVDNARSTRGLLLRTVLVLMTLGFGGLLVRLFAVQVGGHRMYLERAVRMRMGTDVLAAYRGDIRFANGLVAARDVAAFEVGIDPRFASLERLPAAVRVVADGLGYPAETRRRLIRSALKAKEDGKRYVRLAAAVDPPVAEALRRALEILWKPEERRALVLTQRTRREYPLGDLAAQTVGITSSDGAGLEGVELAFDDYLAARPGRREVFRDASQKVRIVFPENAEVPAVQGFDVVLTLDPLMQRVLHEELQRGLERHRAEAGTGIILDCRDGSVRAMVSLPAYDPMRRGEYPRPEWLKRRKNRAVENEYEPGSVIKPFIAAVALEKHVHGRYEPVWEGGAVMRLAHRTVRDVHDHGPLTLEDAVVYSSNIGMSLIGLKLGREGLIEALDRFGLARPTGIALPGEAGGYRRPRKEWREEFTSVSVSFGYAVRVTPIQLAAAFAALINGGILYRPRLVERLERAGERIPIPPVAVGRAVSEETSRAMREILRRVIEDGTGRFLQLEGLAYGGKTGTADMGRGYTKEDYLASFEAFAPYESPRLVILVMIEKPRAGRYYGGVVAGPVVGRVLARLFGAQPAPGSVIMTY